VSSARRPQLLALKLAALVREHGDATLVKGEFGPGAALMAGDDAWVLLDADPARGLGPALAWSTRRQARRVHVLAESATGILARRAECFAPTSTLGPIAVGHIDGRAVLPAIAEPLAESCDPPPEHLALLPVIVDGGATPIVEHGVLTGEVAGLEVCRATTDLVDGVTRLEVGIGAHDREAFQLLHGDRPTREALADVVAAVAPYRRPDSPPHPLNRIARARALRAQLIDAPEIIGATGVRAVPPPARRPNVRDEWPCVAIADIDGRLVTVVCSSGVDLDVVPFACDARAATGVAECLVVMRGRDALPIQHELVAALLDPVRIVALADRATAPSS